jgi:hypothetical protein
VSDWPVLADFTPTWTSDPAIAQTPAPIAAAATAAHPNLPLDCLALIVWMSSLHHHAGNQPNNPNGPVANMT